ncbi:PREDICTED: uncharacterized protein LOC106811909 [Priapulus caudatus]|uniref:Uncharacterized protein LOC106811909 n=1 Tax=Priapulus caudatus TaxID=37621 RepID=A0ABM1EG13_PRICU|nr:PREDICTED: uncharacterized protein LOC106811909 [Priapulus caudatus]
MSLLNNWWPCIHIHCFTETHKEAFKWLIVSNNLYVGPTGYATHTSSTPTAPEPSRRTLAFPSRFLLETDSPMNKPIDDCASTCGVTHECLCHPGHALNVACKIAVERRVSICDVLQTVTANFQGLYRIEIA